MDFKQEKTTDEIRKIASNFIEQESNRKSLITVTDVKMTTDFKKAQVFVTVFPEEFEAHALDFLKRLRADFRDYVKKNSRIGRVPFFDFVIDGGEKARQRIEDISIKIEKK